MESDPASLKQAMAARTRGVGAAWVLCCIGATFAVKVNAQALTSLEFSFSNPGARSLGFGGAFVALADDATAAFANPAGLVQIAKPEVSIEGRSWIYSTPFTSGGRVAGEPTGQGIDTVSVPLRGQSTVDVAGLSYVSLVYPRENWSFAFFQHQLANFGFGLETQGLFGPDHTTSGTLRTTIQRSRVDLEILTRGLAVGFRGGDRASFGLGISRFEPSIVILGWDYLPDDDSDAGHFGAASFLPERLVQIVTLESNTAEWGLTAGFLWRVADRWNVGGLYRQSPDLDFEVNLDAGAAHPAFPAGFRFVDRAAVTYSFPDAIALGLSYRSPSGRWTGALELRHVEYSSFVESFAPQQREPGDALDDAVEIHLGGEYAFFAGTSLLAVRLGAWHDPDHQFRNDADPAEEPYLNAILPPGEDQIHLTGGLGVAFDRLQIDLGVDLSKRIDTLSLSAIYSF